MAYQYPGQISRQDLVDFCRKQLPEIEARNNQLLDALHYAELNNKIHTVHALNEGLMENYGRVKALRDVCEWAKDHLIEESPISNDLDIDNLKEKLKERFA